MTTHFKKLKNLTVIASSLAPILFFLTFICYVYGEGFWFFIPFFVAAVCSLGFPLQPWPSEKTDSETSAFERIRWFFYYIGFILIIHWLAITPEFVNLIKKVSSKESLQDWRIILAMAIWHLCWSLSNYFKSKNLDDKDVVAIYEDSESAS